MILIVALGFVILPITMIYQAGTPGPGTSLFPALVPVDNRRGHQEQKQNPFFSFWAAIGAAVAGIVSSVTNAVSGGKARSSAEKAAERENIRKQNAARLKALKGRKLDELSARERAEMERLQYLQNTNLIVGATAIVVLVAGMGLAAKKLLKK